MVEIRTAKKSQANYCVCGHSHSHHRGAMELLTNASRCRVCSCQQYEHNGLDRGQYYSDAFQNYKQRRDSD